MLKNPLIYLALMGLFFDSANFPITLCRCPGPDDRTAVVPEPGAIKCLVLSRDEFEKVRDYPRFNGFVFAFSISTAFLKRRRRPEGRRASILAYFPRRAVLSLVFAYLLKMATLPSPKSPHPVTRPTSASLT